MQFMRRKISMSAVEPVSGDDFWVCTDAVSSMISDSAVVYLR
jgi:hypothetical protein